tara:strand:+ start:20 stop:202 length:183 start_codon:yes stop_codon:yes gene_type:complete
MNNETNLSDSLFIRLEGYDLERDGTDLCEVCAKYEGMVSEATHHSHNTDMCVDCYMEVNE